MPVKPTQKAIKNYHAATRYEDTVTKHRHIVSKERVASHGEVYTPEPIVNAMLDLVQHTSTVLEPEVD